MKIRHINKSELINGSGVLCLEHYLVQPGDEKLDFVKMLDGGIELDKDHKNNINNFNDGYIRTSLDCDGEYTESTREFRGLKNRDIIVKDFNICVDRSRKTSEGSVAAIYIYRCGSKEIHDYIGRIYKKAGWIN